jgi:hypothetical protein
MDGSWNPNLDWKVLEDKLRALEGSALIARMLVRSLRSRPLDDRARLLATQVLLNVAFKEEEILAYVWPDDEMDSALAAARRLLETGVAEPDEPSVPVPERPE